MAKQNTPSKSKSVPVKPAQPQKENIEAANVASIPDVEEVMKQHKVSSAAPQKRNLTGTRSIFTDLFKLCVEKVIKYEGWDEKNEHPESHPNRFSSWEHTHPFRTYDKKGDKMSTCTPIGGHFHVVEWEDNEDPEAPPRIKSCSGPMVMSRQKVRGVTKQVFVPANEYDDHTHDVEYIRSCKVEFSTTNIEAAKIVAQEAMKTAPLSGVEVR